MVSPSDRYQFEIVDGVLVDDIHDLPSLESKDLNAIYDFNNSLRTDSERKTPLTTDGVESGMRNDTLARLVGKWILEGWGMREVILKSLDWNQDNTPPMSVQEVLQTVNSICTGHLKRNPEDEAGILNWKTSQWQIQLADELKEINEDAPQERVSTVERDPLGLKSFADPFWDGMDSASAASARRGAPTRGAGTRRGTTGFEAIENSPRRATTPAY